MLLHKQLHKIAPEKAPFHSSAYSSTPDNKKRNTTHGIYKSVKGVNSERILDCVYRSFRSAKIIASPFDKCIDK
jgi:hypothetical protein